MDLIKEFENVKDGEELGQGAFGRVCRVIDYHSPAVIKYLKNPDNLKAFMKECKALEKLKHHNIVEYYGCGKKRNGNTEIYGFLMEFCAMKTLKDWIFDAGKFYTMFTVIVWSEQLFAALEYLNFKDHFHRDIKAENLYLTEDFTLKVGDFGLSKMGNRTMAGTYCGTKRYMSPEAWGNQGTVMFSHKSDVYGAGLVLWEIMERRLVFWDKNPDAYDASMHMLQQSQDDFVKLPMGPESVRKIVTSCTKFEYQQRPNATMILDDLRAMKKEYIEYKMDFKPKEDDGRHLYRPIGFNDDLYNGVSVYPGGNSILPGDLQMSSNAMDDQSSILQNTITEYKAEDLAKDPYSYFFSRFEKKFNQLDTAEREKFVLNAKDIISQRERNRLLIDPENQDSEIRKINARKIHTSQLVNDPNALQGTSIEELLAYSIDDEFLIQYARYKDIFGLLIDLKLEPPLSLDLIQKMNTNAEILQKIRFTNAKRIYFKCYLSTVTKDEWYFFEQRNRYGIFIRRDFTEVRRVGSFGKETRKTDGSEEMLFFQEEPIDLDMILSALHKAQHKMERFAAYQIGKFVSVENLKPGSKCLSTFAGRDLPIPGYVFQFRNPPRHSCSCEPLQCPIDGGFPKDVSRDLQLTYHKCATRELIDYIELYTIFHKCVNQLHKRYLCGNRSYDKYATSRGNAYDFAEARDPNFTKHCPMYFHFYEHSTENGNYLLFDCPVNYEDHEQVPCFSKDGFGQIRISNGSFDADSVIKIDASGLLKDYFFHFEQQILDCFPVKPVQVLNQLKRSSSINDPDFVDDYVDYNGGQGFGLAPIGLELDGHD